ncbi:MAG TPA: ABC transporter substrate-binding protein, partial [Symbiobacteriaceae bacterium]|nr:ABC transporter substrate-binding protein [Symbiobacteriaceae bacterium]
DEWALAAEMPKVSADQKTYTVKLKPGIKWSDGTPITAADVAFTMNTFANPDVGSPSHSSFAQIKEARAKDASTVEIELKDVDARFALNALNAAIAPEKPFKGLKPEEIGKQAYGTNIKATITSGPYVWKEWSEKQYHRLERDPNYWGKKPNIQTVVFKIYGEETTAAQAIMQGEIDFFGDAPVPQLEAIKNTKGLHVASSAGPIYDYFSFNFKPENWPDKFVPFTGKKTRQAFGYAMNRKGLVDTVLKGYGTLLNGPFLEASWGYTQGTSFNYPYDPAKAKALLAEDGWTAGSDGLLVKDGHKFEFDLFYRSDNRRRADYAVVIQQNLKDVGIKVNLKPMDFSTLIDNHVNTGKYQGYMGGWQLALDPDAESIFSSQFFPEAGQNSGWYKNEKTDKLWIDGYKTADQAKRKAIYADIAREFSDDPPYVFLCQTNYNTVYGDRVHWADADKPIHALPYGYMFHIFNWWVTK